MPNRLRSLDSKISFFAFADIITAVSGVLIFVALLLATDLGRPTDRRSQAANAEIERRLQETLSRQAEVDAQNHHLQELLATADTAPDPEKLQSDIARLRSQLSDEQKKQAAVAAQMADSQATIAARDKALGLTDLKATIQRLIHEAQLVADQDAKARAAMENLDRQVSQQQSKLLKLRERDGQLWLIPDKSSTTKEPILVTVSGAGVAIDRFDHPDQRKILGTLDPNDAFKAYLSNARSIDQYLVFLVRPSGIETFQDLVKSARDSGFEVGYDALEEERQIHFSTPPALDASAPQSNVPVTTPIQNADGSGGNLSNNMVPAVTPIKPNSAPPVTAPRVPAPPKEKSWWQKFLEWIGIG